MAMCVLTGLQFMHFRLKVQDHHQAVILWIPKENLFLDLSCGLMADLGLGSHNPSMSILT